jgi:hypothetical protein
MKLASLGSRLSTLDTRRVQPPPKTAAPLYSSVAYVEWREGVISRAGGRCEEIVNGKRCWKAAPRNRMFADHRVEVKDGGALFDIANGQCLCGAHHSAKTARARADRHRG